MPEAGQAYPAHPQQAVIPKFSEQSEVKGLNYTFNVDRLAFDSDLSVSDANRLLLKEIEYHMPMLLIGSVAAGDITRDGYTDFLIPNGAENMLHAYVYSDGVYKKHDILLPELEGVYIAGLTLVDLDGDEAKEVIVSQLAIGEKRTNNVRLFIYKLSHDLKIKLADEYYLGVRSIHGVAVSDIDLDGDLDIGFGRWDGRLSSTVKDPHLLVQAGNTKFIVGDELHGINESFGLNGEDRTYSPYFSDINADGVPDLMMASDFEKTQYFHGSAEAGYVNMTNPFAIDDENGMGSAVADFDNDGDLDWFVTSIYDEACEQEKLTLGPWGCSGNRLYINEQGGKFSPANKSQSKSIKDGGWGWGACAADFNNDGWLDIFHTNGYGFKDKKLWQEVAGSFMNDLPRLFINNGSAIFSESAELSGITDADEGRGVSCGDFDRDGDIDIITVNINESIRYLENKGDESNGYLGIKLNGSDKNREGIGAKISISFNGEAQYREVTLGSNYLSHNPVEAHFGLGSYPLGSNKVDVTIVWPGADSLVTKLKSVNINQWIEVTMPRENQAEPFEAYKKLIIH